MSVQEQASDDDDVTYEYLYFSASGPSYVDCCFIGYRYSMAFGFSSRETESWVCRIALDGDQPTFYAELGTSAWLTRLWRSPLGWVFVSDADGLVRLNRR